MILKLPEVHDQMLHTATVWVKAGDRVVTHRIKFSWIAVCTIYHTKYHQVLLDCGRKPRGHNYHVSLLWEGFTHVSIVSCCLHLLPVVKHFSQYPHLEGLCPFNCSRAMSARVPLWEEEPAVEIKASAQCVLFHVACNCYHLWNTFHSNPSWKVSLQCVFSHELSGV